MLKDPEYIINPDDDVKLCYRPIDPSDPLLDESTELGKKYKLAKEICDDSQHKKYQVIYPPCKKCGKSHGMGIEDMTTGKIEPIDLCYDCLWEGFPNHVNNI